MSRLRVSLRISGDGLDPKAITKKLGVKPTLSAKKGEDLWRGEVVLTQRTGMWTHALTEREHAEERLSDAIDALLAKFPVDVTLWRELADDYKLELFCGVYVSEESEGVELRPRTLEMLAARHIALNLDIFRE